jgi:hypothetical protein
MALNAKKLKLIEMIIECPTKSNTALGEELGVNRNSISKWRADPEFKDALSARLKEVWRDAEAMAVANMQKLANEGCFQANKYILDSLNYAPAQRIEADINTDVVINIKRSED